MFEFLDVWDSSDFYYMVKTLIIYFDKQDKVIDIYFYRINPQDPDAD